LDEHGRHRRLRVRRRGEFLPARPGHDGNAGKELLAVAAKEGGGLIRDADDEVEALPGVLPPDEIAEREALVLGVSERVDVFGVDVDVGAVFPGQARPDDPVDVGVGVEVGPAAPQHEYALLEIVFLGAYGRSGGHGHESRAEREQTCGPPGAVSRQNSSRAANWNARGPPVPKAWPARALGWP